MDPENRSILRDIILNTRKPVVLKKVYPNWKCFDCSIEEWCEKFDENLQNKERVEFEQMPMRFGDCPQWERYRSKIELTFKEFLGEHSKHTERWTAFNYKRIEDIPQQCRYDIDFSCFGFSEAAKDASFWLTSEGANTPCHYDTYGCNIVVQVYGRKHWLLFPPETKLTPTRLPYEESSVYCTENFFSPKNLEPLSAFGQSAFECTLGAGDILVVPRNWWHYVESLDTSLSVNAWVPLEIDIDAQVEECIVKYIVETVANGETEAKKQYILNPNQLELITSSEDLFEILRFLLENISASGNKLKNEKYPYEYLSEEDVNALIQKSTYEVNVLRALHPSEFDNLMHAKRDRYVDMNQPNTSVIDPIQEALLNAICNPSVVRLIKDKFLKTYSSRI